MPGKDANSKTTRKARWKVLASWALGTVAIAALVIAARSFWGPGSASAEGKPKAKRTFSESLRRVFSPKKNFRTTSSSTPSKAKNASLSRSAGKAQSSGIGAASAQSVPKNLKVLAVVNGEQISRQKIARESLRRYGEEVLESVVFKTLILNECKQKGIVITERDVDEEIQREAAKFKLSVQYWLKMLRDEHNLSEDQYRREIVWPKLALLSLAAKEITVSKEELRRAFDSEFGSRIKVRMISVALPDKAKQLRAKALADPENFGLLAKNESEDSRSASARGLIPPIRKNVGDEKLERAAFALKEGEISEVIHTANQYLILKCEKIIPKTYIAQQHLADAQRRLTDIIRDNKLRKTSKELSKRLEKSANVVNVLNNPRMRDKMPGVAAMVNGREITIAQLTEECLLRHASDVLDIEINRMLLAQELKRRKKEVTEEDLDREISRAADAYGYWTKDGSPDVDRWLGKVTETEGATIELYVSDAVWPTVALKNLVRNKIEITKQDLERGFEANYGPRVEVLAIVLGNQRQAQTVWEMARGNPKDQFFGDLAAQYSVEPASQANLGKVPPIRRHGGQPALEEEAFRLKAGELSSIISLGDKYLILRCQGRTKPVEVSFEEVEEDLYKDIHEKKLRFEMTREYDRLKEIAQIDDFLNKTSQAGKRRALQR